MRWFSGYAPPYIYICHARVFGSLSRVGVLVPVLVDACRNDPSILALRRKGSIGGGESLHDPGIEGIEAVPRRAFVSVDDKLVELVVGRIIGRIWLAFCRALA